MNFFSAGETEGIAPEIRSSDSYSAIFQGIYQDFLGFVLWA